ncbi:3-hydroxyacyl-CoA dehydrogenase [Azohydromonas caseinilytica]|uniref:3-hydroxyacyl-CoA dehydrogenase n=1 Tax=Azohydromonas caseinilytica TaxID=2728836 RepID=A0A848F8Q8_9BURK|nr:3-hydroxyacyl-CoA dehydrogenase [Azohydromonas caseinilytica]NML14421.1 3-hydroxyacyl-CoA dehydrogenase [Azohydromonas caseinilytica]
MSVLQGAPLLVVGAGIMGAGIAQVAAQAGHRVWLYDLREGAAAEAKGKLGKSLEGLVAKGKLTAQAVDQTLAHIEPITALETAASARLVVEAVVEKLDAKRSLFRQLESLVAEDCVLATNTSSISVTAIANGLQRPGRLVGMHFFNPVPLMRLVEVVSGLQTEPAVAQAIHELSKQWGKVPVHARSTPGFIVNRIARPYYAETLALLQERAALPAVLDACLRAAGFRMGPCELMDLIGHDTNFSVTQSVYEANFFDKRFVPSLVQRELVEGGLLGRKSGRGFYDYADGAPKPALPAVNGDGPPEATILSVHGNDAVARRIRDALTARGRGFEPMPDSDWTGLEVDGAELRLTDGRPASQVGAGEAADVAVFDLPLSQAPGAALAWAPAVQASAAWCAAAPLWLQELGFNPQRLADAPGLVVARTIAMLINEAADAVHQGVCDEAGADAAMKLGVNYPQGPFEWLRGWDTAGVINLLDALDAHYRGERYRVSPGLRLCAWRRGLHEVECIGGGV